MRKGFWVLSAIALLTVMLVAQQKVAKTQAAPAAAKHNVYAPGDIKWGPPPPFVPKGAEFAVLAGDPMGTGPYTIRLKAPDGYKIAPHTHPKTENVSVISGTLKVGLGDKFDESKMNSFAAGSFAEMLPSMHHYVMASGDTVVQVHGIGPVKFNYINPADDPSKTSKQ